MAVRCVGIGCRFRYVSRLLCQGMETKLCPHCQVTKPHSDFPTERRKGKPDRPAWLCRGCWNAYSRERNSTPEAKARAKAAYETKKLRLGVGSLAKPYSEKTAEQKAKAYAAVKAWRAAHLEQHRSEGRQGVQMRRSHAYKAAWPIICEHYGNVCLCCGFPRKLCFDHVQPMKSGGANALINGQPLCVGCNTAKGQVGNGDKDYRPDRGAWIAELVRLNPWLADPFPSGRWHLSSEGRVRSDEIREKAKGELVRPEGNVVGSATI